MLILFILLFKHFRKRTIHKIKRKTTKRNVYEKQSRKIRFITYLTVLEEFRSSNGIILGHHKGDIEENVLLNIVKGCRLLNLSGINLASLIEGIHIWRPLLSHSKTEILCFAHSFGIPYLKDSTPIWSTRGRMRNQILPLLISIFGKGFQHNLLNVGIQSKKIDILIKDNALQPTWKECMISELCIVIKLQMVKNKSSIFWKEMFNHICEKKLGVPKIREKPIKQVKILKRIKK